MVMLKRLPEGESRRVDHAAIRRQNRNAAADAIGALHTHIVNWVRQGYAIETYCSQAMRFLGEATNKFFDEQYESASRLAARGSSFVDSPAHLHPGAPIDLSTLLPAAVPDGRYFGLAVVVREGIVFQDGSWADGVPLQVVMVTSDGQLLRLEFETSKASTLQLRLNDLAEIEFTADGGRLELADYDFLCTGGAPTE